MSLPFDRLKAAQEASAEPEYATPTRIRLSALCRIVQNWIADGGTTEAHLQEMWLALEAERNRLAEFLGQQKDDPEQMEQSRQVSQRLVAGIQCHAQACACIAMGLAEGRSDACEEAERLLAEGDRLMGEAESQMTRLRAMYPVEP